MNLPGAVIWFLTTLVFWAGIAYRYSHAAKEPFWTSFLIVLGLRFWFTKPWALLLISAVPAFAMVSLTKDWLWNSPAHTLLARALFVFWLLPFINIAAYIALARFENARKVVVWIATAWFGLVLAAIVTMALVGMTM